MNIYDEIRERLTEIAGENENFSAEFPTEGHAIIHHDSGVSLSVDYSAVFESLSGFGSLEALVATLLDDQELPGFQWSELQVHLHFDQGKILDAVGLRGVRRMLIAMILSDVKEITEGVDVDNLLRPDEEAELASMEAVEDSDDAA